jgi:hypothetical protein
MIREAEVGIIGGLIAAVAIGLLCYWLEYLGRPRPKYIKPISVAKALSMWYAHRKRKGYWF